MKLIKQVA